MPTSPRGLTSSLAWGHKSPSGQAEAEQALFHQGQRRPSWGLQLSQLRGWGTTVLPACPGWAGVVAVGPAVTAVGPVVTAVGPVVIVLAQWSLPWAQWSRFWRFIYTVAYVDPGIFPAAE